MRKRQPRVIGSAVRNYRTTLGLTQSQVAELADVTPETLSRIERNRMSASLDLARRIASALHVSVDDLFVSARPLIPPSLRPVDARVLALLRRYDDAEVERLLRALRVLLDLGQRFDVTPTE